MSYEDALVRTYAFGFVWFLPVIGTSKTKNHTEISVDEGHRFITSKQLNIFLLDQLEDAFINFIVDQNSRPTLANFSFI